MDVVMKQSSSSREMNLRGESSPDIISSSSSFSSSWLMAMTQQGHDMVWHG